MILLKERAGKLLEELETLIYEKEMPIRAYRVKKLDARPRADEYPDTSGWPQMDAKEIWGGHREFYYFETEVTAPEEFAGEVLVYGLRTGREGEWDALNPQFLVWVNGQIRQGLDVNHREVYLTDCAKAGEKFRILLAAYTGDRNFFLHLDSKLRACRPEVEKYYYDLKVPWETARLLDKDSDEYITIIRCLTDSLNLLDLRRPYSEAFFRSLRAAQKNITENFYQKYCGSSRHTVCCVGHTHIDVAWQWTLSTTEDKAVRSFSTVLENMKHYPEYKFMSSQPQLYKYVKQNAPAVYEQIKERIAQGRWEPEGGMWVEADCNLPSGESLVRQFLYGTRFFEREFGKKNEILWLPDVFGYSAALPQIMKKCGIRYFMTTKISWNEFNKMPYDTFMWEGIDGTQVLTHFIPARDYNTPAEEGGTKTAHFTTYNAMLTPSQVKGSWQRYSQKELNDEVLMSYGYGDGGGGPTREMLEYQRRMEQGIPGCPNTKQSFALEFFRKLEADVQNNRALPHWVGELYLEYHRGTYTSMARNKRYNRKSEFAYENLEFYRVLAERLTGLPYPKQEIADAWEVILRNQFHDILPGSAIKEVYDDSRAEYEKILAENRRLEAQAFAVLADQVSGAEGDVLVLNPNGMYTPSPVLIPADAAGDGAAALICGGKTYPLQKTEDGYLAVIDEMPVRGWKLFKVERGTAGGNPEQAEEDTRTCEKSGQAEAGGFTGGNPEQAEADTAPGRESGSGSGFLYFSVQRVETVFFLIALNEKGQFTSIYDKVQEREIIPEGQYANVIISYEDKPHNYDNWDINHYYREKSWPVEDTSEITVTEAGPARGCIRVTHPYLESVITQYLYFYPDLYRIDIRNEIDWKEHHILLRDYFPVDVHTNEATYEIQYGNVKRPTHFNTSWDFARFEVCAHKWLDVSEDGYGVSILNDCKYGCDVHDGVIGLSMLKAGLYPNPEADKEHHTFWYSICPHAGDFRTGNTAAKAYLFNNPCRAAAKMKEGGSLPEEYSFVSADAENIVIEAVKKAEDSGDLIVRLYECWNRRTKTALTFAGPIKKLALCNLLEREDEPLPFDGNRAEITLKPYEIVTLKLRLVKEMLI